MDVSKDAQEDWTGTKELNTERQVLAKPMILFLGRDFPAFLNVLDSKYFTTVV
jgi:hypothetical protein